jgi:hypothetical protein
MAAVVSRLETIIEGMPKEGYKAAVVQGVIERIRELAELSVRAKSLIECLGASKGYCKENICVPACARIYMIKENDTTYISKTLNAAGITIMPDQIRISVKDFSLQIGSDGVLTYSIPGGIKETVNLKDLDEVYKKSYTIKMVVRKVGRKVDLIISDLQNCARMSAIVC